MKLRISLPTIALMLCATATAVAAMIWTESNGFCGQRGAPFTWYEWSDCYVISQGPGSICWFGLLADLSLWIAVIISVGRIVEKELSKSTRK